MSRTQFSNQVHRFLRIANYCESNNSSTNDGLEALASAKISRRNVIKAAGAAGLAISPLGRAFGFSNSSPRIAIIGAGLAGLACADRLETKGYSATIFEASSRVGGRCFSNRTLVPGMACENGGEFIDTGHKAMLAFANQFNLARESVVQQPGEERFHFFGQLWSEEDIVEQLRVVVARMQPDLHAISGSASFYSKNAADIQFDNMDLATYLHSRCAGYPLIEAVLNEAYLAEYGLETSQQSTLNFLGFMRLNKQSKFEPFGTSDERFHLTDGNDGVVQGLRARITSPVSMGAKLTRLGKNGAGKYTLYFNGSGTPDVFDAVVVAIPFTVLRGVQIDASVGLSSDKRRAIDQLGYGMNAKTMVAFDGRVWSNYGSNGFAYSDKPNVQTVWEANPTHAGSRAILTDYASGDRGVALKTNKVQQQVGAFLSDLEPILPGVQASASKSGGAYVAHLEHWPSNPLTKGSYTCMTPGQFTTIEGLNAEASAALKFAGEHSDSFYSWQGYMEGGCLSGIRAANEVIADIRAGRI